MYIYIYMYIYTYICIYIYIYICIYILCVLLFESVQIFSKKHFLLKPVIFRFAQKP